MKRIYAWTALVGLLTTCVSGGGSADADQAQVRTAIDRFGQAVNAQYPLKISTESDLKGDLESDRAYYSSLKPPAYDIYGGLLRSGVALGLKSTGFFHVEKHGMKWHLVDPAGNLFYYKEISELGIDDSFTDLDNAANTNEGLPGDAKPFKATYKDPKHFSYYIANVIRKYGKPFAEKPTPNIGLSNVSYADDRNIDRMIASARKWGFNAGGPFSPRTAAYKRHHFAYASSIPLYVPRVSADSTFDPFDKVILAQIDRDFARELSPAANDPLIFGYYLSTESIMEEIPTSVPGLDGTHACKRRLVSFLKDRYRSIDAFAAAWGLKAVTFNSIINLPMTSTTNASRQDMKEYTELFLDAYHKVLADTFHRYDKNHLLLGNRFNLNNVNDEGLCRIEGKYTDIMSIDYYTYTIDTDFLKRICNWTGRPIILSQFSYSSSRESGMPGSIFDLPTQALRGKAYCNYVEQAASTGFVVGQEWMCMTDQSTAGNWYANFNGDSVNIGLLSLTDRPYKEMLAQMMVTNYGIYDVVLGKHLPFSLSEDPRFTMKSGGMKTLDVAHVAGPIAIDGSGRGFPDVPATPIAVGRLALGRGTGSDGAGVRACWDDKNLYILVNVSDPTPMKNPAEVDEDLWLGDAIELFVGYDDIGQGGALLPSDRQLIMSASRSDGKYHWHLYHAQTSENVQMAVVPAGSKGYTLEAAIPFSILGFTPRSGQSVRFDLAIDDSENSNFRVAQYVWNGDGRNNSDRSNWGTARFAP